MVDVSRPPRRYGRLACAAFVALRWVGTHLWPGKAVYRRLLKATLTGTRVDVLVPDLPAALDGLRIVQLSDLHAGPFLDEGSLEPVVDLVTAYDPDVLVVTGDLITDTIDDVELLGTFLERLPRRLGAFCVLGNHDHRGRRERELAARLLRRGVRVLLDDAAAVRREDATLRVVGLRDIEEGKGADLDVALTSARDDDGATVLLCHHPAVVESLPRGRFDLVLCGHTHGGQLRAPWTPTDRGRALAGVRALPGGGLAFVTRGLGALVVPLRIGAPPEVACLTLRRFQDDDRGVEPAALPG